MIDGLNNAEENLTSIESERGVAALFAQRRLPRSYHWLYKRSDDYARAHMPTVIDGLCETGNIAANGDGTWTQVDPNANAISAQGDGSCVNFPVSMAWEDALYEALLKKGERVALHRMECGYELALAFAAFAAKLDVEIVGRQHELASQKAKDIVRDQRLKANGWTVLRLSVAEVVADLYGSRDKVLSIWNKLKDGGYVQ